MTHPSLEYVLVAATAAIVTYLLTPLARLLAVRIGAIALPRDRDVHAVATPRMGGVALFAGFALAVFVGSRLPTLRSAFDQGPEMRWIIVAGALICLLGILDDRYELDSLEKLAGQVLASGIMVTLGEVQIGYLPWGTSTTLTLDSDLGVPVTILLTVLIINAVNFIDGLDGLAAGVTAIAAGAFFVVAYHVTREGFLDVATASTLLAAALAGCCLGFLPHNFFPARIFMGDSGSMLVGLMLSAAAATASTSTDPQAFTNTFGSLALFLPLLIPAAVLALPLVDLLLAVVRRVGRGRSPFAPDKQHLHHRFLEIGHTHRRAVLLLYFWSSVVAFAGVVTSFDHRPPVIWWFLLVLVIIGVAASIVPGLRARRARRAAAAQVAGTPDRTVSRV